MLNKLGDDLRQVQNRRKFLYKISGIYLNKMGQWKYDDVIDWNKSISYIDYLNMEELKKEIKLLDIQGQKIVRKICECLKKIGVTFKVIYLLDDVEWKVFEI